MQRSASIDRPESRLRAFTVTSLWVVAVIVALFGLVLVLAAWNEGWPLWLGFGLMSPLGLLFVLDDKVDQSHHGGGEDFAGGDVGGDFGGDVGG